MKVLCIRLMQLLGPQQAQVDTVETCLYALLKLLKLQTVRALSIEDFLDFLLMDVEHVPTSYGKHLTSPPIAQQRMHHKFAVQPDEGNNLSQTGQQTKCNHCLKEEETKTALTKESPFQSQTLLRNPSLQQISRESIHQQQEDHHRKSNEHQSALIFHLESRIVISNSQSLAFDNQIGSSRQNRDTENLSRNKPNDIRGGTAQFGNKSTVLPEGPATKTQHLNNNYNNAYSQDHLNLNQRVVDIADSIDQVGGIPSQTGAEEDEQADLEAAKSILVSHQAEDVVDEVESQRQIISQYMENLLSQQRHEVNKDIQRTLQTLNQEDEGMRPIDFGSQRSIASRGPVLPRHRSFMASPVPGYTQQRQRLDDSNPHQYMMSGTITNQLNAPASGFGMPIKKQTRNVAIKTVNSNQYKGIKMDQTLNSHQEPRNQNIVGTSQYIDNSNLEIAYPLETSNRQNEYFSRRKFSDHQIPLQSLFQTHSLQASRRGDQSHHHNRQNSSSKQNFKMMFQNNPGLRNNLRKQYQASEIGTVQLRQLHDDQPLNGNIQLQEESQRRIIGNNEDEMSMSQSIMNLNKVVSGDENRSEFGDIGLRRGGLDNNNQHHLHQTPEMLIERKAPFGSHKKSLPVNTNTLKSAIKDKTLALSQLRLGSKKQRSILEQDNQSNSIIGQNLFDPSANNSIRGDDHLGMYQTSQDIFNNSRSRLAQAAAGQTSQKDLGYFTKPLTKRQYTNKLSNLENYLTEDQSEIQLGQQGVLVGQGVTRIVRQSINDKLNGNGMMGNRQQMVMAQQNNLVLKSDQQSVMPKSIDRLDEDGSFVIDDLVQNGPFCFICGLELEDHALDHNVDLHFYQDLLQDCFVGDKNNTNNIIMDKNYESSLNGQQIHHEHNFPSVSMVQNQKQRKMKIGSNFSSSQVSHRDLNQFTQLKLNIENKKKKDHHHNQSSNKQQILRQFTDSQIAASNNSQTQSPRFNADIKLKSESKKAAAQNDKKQQINQRQSMLFKIEPDINLQQPITNYSDYDIPKTGTKQKDGEVQSGEFTRDKTHPVFTSFGVMPEKVMLKVTNNNDSHEQQQMQQNSNRSRSVQQAAKVTLKYKSGKSELSNRTNKEQCVVTDSETVVQIPKVNQTKESSKPVESLAAKLISINGAKPVVYNELQQDQIDIVNQIFTKDQIKAFEGDDLCQICCSVSVAEKKITLHSCDKKVCTDCMAKCDNVCPYCQPKYTEPSQKDEEFKLQPQSRCLNCGSLPHKIDNELKERVCLQCDYAQCTQCTLAAHIGMNCGQAVEKSYMDLKKVFSSVTLDPTIQYQICTKCDTILEKALRCNHYHCDRCRVTFCMYCRLPYTESHMNPFTQDACCLFKIGAKKKGKDFSTTLEKKNDTQSSKLRWFAFALLMLWLLFGLIVSFIFIPIVSYYKMVRNPRSYLSDHKSKSYLIAKTSAKKNLHLTSYALWICLVALTPICMPFAYIAGITYFVHMMLFPVVQERSDRDSQHLLPTNKTLSQGNRAASTTRKNEKVHTEISLLNDKKK